MKDEDSDDYEKPTDNMTLIFFMIIIVSAMLCGLFMVGNCIIKEITEAQEIKKKAAREKRSNI